MPGPVLDSVNVLAELNKIGWEYTSAGEQEVKVLCPFHDDHNPSCLVYLETKRFWCTACGQKGDIATLLGMKLRVGRPEMLLDLGTRYKLVAVGKTVSPQVIEQYHKQLFACAPLMKLLADRGVDIDLITQYRLGEHEQRVIIPIKDISGMFVNLRSYLPGAPSNMKFRNIKGFGKNSYLYPIEQMQYDHIVLCAGEMKAIVAARILNPHGIGAVATTGGETKGGFAEHLLPSFRDKKVTVCFDIDKGGEIGTQDRATKISAVAKWIGTATLPLDIKKYPKGDINDFIAHEKGDLLAVVNSAVEWKVPEVIVPYADNAEPVNVDINDAMHAKNAHKRIQLSAAVTALWQTPIACPKDVEVKCNRKQDMCTRCAVGQSSSQIHRVPPESASILEILSEEKKKHRTPLMEALGIPTDCPVAQFVPLTYHNVEEVRISPRLEITANTTDRKQQPAYCVTGDDNKISLNENYLLTGRMHPHPKNQQATLMISNAQETQSTLATYIATPESLEPLKRFRPETWDVESLQSRLDSIYGELERYVTQIYLRRDAHLMVDLAYHSVLNIPLDGKVRKGWVEVILAGDSAQGKSEITCGSENRGGLSQFYGLGEKVEAKNATVAGILGGMHQIGGRWFVSWGKIAINDGRLIILEELHGNAPILGKLTDTRSSGEARLDKIEKAITNARCRIIATTNSLSGRHVSAYPFGVEIFAEVALGHMEDVRRFDCGLILSKSDLREDDLEEAKKKAMQYISTNGHRQFSADVCRELILWCWTRPVENVEFETEALVRLERISLDMMHIYDDSMMLVDKGSFKHKLGRLSAALAGRTFSTTDDFQTLIVRKCHVEYIGQWLCKIYDSPAMGYRAYSEAARRKEQMRGGDQIAEHIRELEFPADFVSTIMSLDEIGIDDIIDIGCPVRDDAHKLLSLLIRKHALIKVGRKYRKTPGFITFLKDLQANGNLQDNPKFLKPEM